MAASNSSSDEIQALTSPLTNRTHQHFFVWREFLWGAIAGAFGEGMMHPIDTIKTRIQSQAVIRGSQSQKSILQMVRTVWVADGLRGFYRGITPGITGSLATGATYFGVIESTKKWVEEVHPSLGGHWAHFIAGGIGDTLGSFVYVPCEVVKQRMQVQGTRDSWSSVIMKDNVSQKSGVKMYSYYSGMFQAGCSIWKEQGLKGLYAGYWSTLARDVPFAGLMVTFYEALKDLTEYGKQRWLFPGSHRFLLQKLWTQNTQRMAMASNLVTFQKSQGLQVFCRKKERDWDHYPYKVIEVTPPPKDLGVRCFPSNMQCGESVTIEGQAYTISAVVHRYQLRKGKYEPSEKRLDVQSTGRYILNLYLENLLEQS